MTKFRQKFCVNWIDLYIRAERRVAPTEVITRFLRHKRDYRTVPSVEAKERAFLPHQYTEGAAYGDIDLLNRKTKSSRCVATWGAQARQ